MSYGHCVKIHAALIPSTGACSFNPLSPKEKGCPSPPFVLASSCCNQALLMLKTLILCQSPAFFPTSAFSLEEGHVTEQGGQLRRCRCTMELGKNSPIQDKGLSLLQLLHHSKPFIFIEGASYLECLSLVDAICSCDPIVFSHSNAGRSGSLVKTVEEPIDTEDRQIRKVCTINLRCILLLVEAVLNTAWYFIPYTPLSHFWGVRVFTL